jgi:predicted acetyltransferase
MANPLLLEELSEKHESGFLQMLLIYQLKDPVTFATLYDRGVPWSKAEFKKFLKVIAAEKMDWRPKARKTSLTRYVLTGADGVICGNGLMRFPLDSETEINGGNLRFDVPPDQRGKDHAALVLNGMLFEAVRAGMARVLLTCEPRESAVIRAILRNRGELQDTVTDKKTGLEINRYWIHLR